MEIVTTGEGRHFVTQIKAEIVTSGETIVQSMENAFDLLRQKVHKQIEDNNLKKGTMKFIIVPTETSDDKEEFRVYSNGDDDESE